MLKAVVSLLFTVTIHAHEALYSSHNFRQRVKKAFRRVQVWVFCRARRVFAVSGFTRNALVEAGVDEDRVATVFNGVEAGELLQPQRESRILEETGLAGKSIILTVARLDVHKGHDVVIRAMPAILEQEPEAVYVIAGDGPMMRQLEEQVEEAGLTGRVVLLGALPRPDVLALLKACRVFVLNSRVGGGNAEGFGIALLEAAVFKKPTVGGRSGGIPEAMEDGVTGILVDPLSPGEVAGAILRILGDPDLAARLGEAGCRRATTEFTWERVIERILASLDS
jgi:phosphatidylinositol alpha-1,6-mannosyltransferase